MMRASAVSEGLLKGRVSFDEGWCSLFLPGQRYICRMGCSMGLWVMLLLETFGGDDGSEGDAGLVGGEEV